MIRSRSLVVLLGILGSGFAAGCTHAADMTIRNPLAAHAIDANRIVKEHSFTEKHRGLPAGSMADQAVLVEADAKHLCFDVTLHELDPLDLSQANVALSAPNAETLKRGKVDAEAPSEKVYEGLVPIRRVTGSETTCASKTSNGGCERWETRPTYSESYVPGPVSVFEARGKVCFDNRVANETTEQLSLELRLDRQTPRTSLFSFNGGGGKKVVFRWGFQNNGAVATGSSSPGPDKAVAPSDPSPSGSSPAALPPPQPPAVAAATPESAPPAPAPMSCVTDSGVCSEMTVAGKDASDAKDRCKAASGEVRDGQCSRDDVLATCAVESKQLTIVYYKGKNAAATRGILRSGKLGCKTAGGTLTPLAAPAARKQASKKT